MPSARHTSQPSNPAMPLQNARAPIELDIFSIPPELNASALDGSLGSNRARNGQQKITADNDVAAIKAWLARMYDSKTTFDNYRKEAERLLLWARIELGKPISSLSHEDLLQYRAFLHNPQPPERWIMPRKVARGDPAWRPFAGPLSASSQRQAMVILNGLFSWLVNAGYLAGNPLALSRQRQSKAAPRITRYLDDELWQEVKQTIAALPKQIKREREHYYRLRWLFSLLYLCGLRISEVAENNMGGFFCRRPAGAAAGTEGHWWLELMGKGKKLRLVPASPELMQELAQYRQELGLAPYPLTGESTPLILPIGGQPVAMTRGALHAIIKQVFSQTAARLQQSGSAIDFDVQQLMRASAHWLRHTAGSHMANQALDLRYVRDNLGHESLSTTSRYLHSADEQRHVETTLKHKINW